MPYTRLLHQWFKTRPWSGLKQLPHWWRSVRHTHRNAKISSNVLICLFSQQSGSIGIAIAICTRFSSQMPLKSVDAGGGAGLEGVVAAFAGTDSYGIVYVVDEDFAITVGTGVYLVNGKVYYLLGSFV